jgi:hypothetical protein
MEGQTMQSFKLSKKSWHYRLLRWSDNFNRYDNFCNYLWAVIRALLKWALFGILGLFVLATFCSIVWYNPFEFLGVASTFVLCICGSAKILEIKERRVGVVKTPGFFALKYKSFKDKFCPKIEWVN